MDTATTGQVNASAAEIYEAFFVPALFAEWSPRVVRAAGLVKGDHVLDVACGTGVLAREALQHVAPEGRVTGLDRNEGMLAVARSTSQEIDWRAGIAENLPFPDNAFDAVVSQFGLMFFEDRRQALREMRRVLKPGGRLAVAVFCSLGNTPGYRSMVDLLNRLFGERHADALRAPYALGDEDGLLALFRDAGLAEVSLATVEGEARFPSIASWVETDVKGWTLADMIDDQELEMLQEAARREFQPFVQEDGTVRFAHPAHIVTVKNA